jgi:hypothetical protein
MILFSWTLLVSCKINIYNKFYKIRKNFLQHKNKNNIVWLNFVIFFLLLKLNKWIALRISGIIQKKLYLVRTKRKKLLINGRITMFQPPNILRSNSPNFLMKKHVCFFSLMKIFRFLIFVKCSLRTKGWFEIIWRFKWLHFSSPLDSLGISCIFELLKVNWNKAGLLCIETAIVQWSWIICSYFKGWVTIATANCWYYIAVFD